MSLDFDGNITDLSQTSKIELFSFDSMNETNQFEQESFPIIPFNQDIFSEKNIHEIDEEILFSKNDINVEEKNVKTKKKFFINNSKSTKLKGRKRKREIFLINDKQTYIHDKFGTDNLLRKIQVHYLSFIVQYANAILNKLEYDEFFVKLDYKLKKTVNKNYISFLKGLTIGEILRWDISPKFKNIEPDYNRNIYDKVVKNPIIKNIFSEKYISLFKDIYFENKRMINLTKYGLNDNIKLPEKKVKMFKELLEKIEEKEDANKKNEYINKLKNCINKIFLSTQDNN
jgi:hypothetical protein